MINKVKKPRKRSRNEIQVLIANDELAAKAIPFKKDIFPDTTKKSYRRIKKPQHPVSIHYYV